MEEEDKSPVNHLTFIKFEYMYMSMCNLFDYLHFNKYYISSLQVFIKFNSLKLHILHNVY